MVGGHGGRDQGAATVGGTRGRPRGRGLAGQPLFRWIAAEVLPGLTYTEEVLPGLSTFRRNTAEVLLGLALVRWITEEVLPGLSTFRRNTAEVLLGLTLVLARGLGSPRLGDLHHGGVMVPFYKMGPRAPKAWPEAWAAPGWGV